MFKEGNWVRHKTSSLYAPQATYDVGYILQSAKEINVRIYVPETGKEQWVGRRNLEDYEDVLPEVKMAARKVFADLALDLKNEEWFREVSG